jgi:hypothetical protein
MDDIILIITKKFKSDVNMRSGNVSPELDRRSSSEARGKPNRNGILINIH